jgi:hypothetical protein
VIVSDATNTKTSQVARVNLCFTGPQISTPPVDQIGALGGTATFNAGFSGDQPLKIQWRADGVIIPSATNATYTLANIAVSNTITAYDVVIANACGSVTSTPPAHVVFPHGFFACDGLPGFWNQLVYHQY